MPDIIIIITVIDNILTNSDNEITTAILATDKRSLAIYFVEQTKNHAQRLGLLN